MKITIGTSQFPISKDILSNKTHIIEQMHYAGKMNCDLIHFPECSLSGYAGTDMESYDGYDWEMLRQSTLEIIDFARTLKLWTLLGSAHRLTGINKPHNSLYIISNEGELVDRYDKLYCAGDESECTGDLAHYTPGDHFSTFSVNGLTCGVQICHDCRYPELYRELKKRGVQVVFHSFHAGNMTQDRKALMEAQVGEPFFSVNMGRTLPEITMSATMISYAANNHVWISCSNTSKEESCFAAFVVRPDGVVSGRLQKDTSGVLVTEINTEVEYYDSSKHWRQRAMDGQFHSGTLVQDIRSNNKTKL